MALGNYCSAKHGALYGVTVDTCRLLPRDFVSSLVLQAAVGSPVLIDSREFFP